MRAVLLAIALLASLPATAAAQGSPHADLSLASQTAWVAPGQPFVARVDVDRVRAPGELTLEVTVHRAVTSRSQFFRTLAGDLLGRVVMETSIPFDELRFDAGGAAPLTIELPEDLRPGVHPVAIVARDADGDEIDALHTHAVRVPAEPVEVPLSVAWLLDYGVDPALQPDATTELDDADLDQLRVVAAQLGRDVPLTVKPVPETVAALATLDDGRTASALATLLREHQVLWSPFVDLDVAALAGAGRESEIATQRVAGAAVLDELDVERDPRSWSLSGDVTEDALDALVALGIDRVVVDEASLEPIDPDLVGGITLARPFALEAAVRSVDAVAVDAGLSAHFATDDEVLAAHHLLADLAVLHFDSPGITRGVVVRPPSEWTPSEAFLGTAIGGLRTSPLLDATTLDGLFDAVEPLTDDGEVVVRSLAEGVEVPRLGFATTALDRARRSVGALRSLLGTDDPRVDVLDRLLLVALSDDLDADGKARYLQGVADRVEASASAVRVLGDRSYRLTAREGTVPLTLVNDNDFDVVVDLELSSDKLAFTDTDDGEELLGTHRITGLVLEAGSTFTQAVPVKARTSGTSSLRVVMRTPDGALELGRASITITSTFASWVGIVLSIGAAAFLLLWWASHFRTVRRARKLVPPE